MTPTRNRGRLNRLAASCLHCGQPLFGLFGERRGWRCVLVERGGVVYTLLCNVITKTFTRYGLGRTNTERNGAALSLDTTGNVYPIATVARCFGFPRTRMCWLIHVT